MTREATIDQWTSDDCEWDEGRITLDFDNPDIKGGEGNYCATLCVSARQVVNGVVIIPASVAEVAAPQWSIVRSAIRDLGFLAPLRWFDYPALPFIIERIGQSKLPDLSSIVVQKSI